jgi:ABC-2 type transport system ATP-binding protein
VTPAPVIDVHGLTKRYGERTVVDHLDLVVERGRIVGFLGPNGSGKTTTIRMLCGLLTPDGGEGTCLGYDLRRDAAAIKREVGYMTQRFSLYDDLTIEENLDFVARVYAVPARRRAVEASLDRLSLGGRRRQLAGTLSGGWKQRLALASCMLHSPQLLLLDEPTAGVDPRARRDFWDEIHALAAQGITVLVSTHYMDEAERCHRLAYIAWGRLLASGTAEDVIAGSRLSTWVVSAATGESELTQLSARLREAPGVTTLVTLGATLRISALDPAAIAPTLEELRASPTLTVAAAQPSLEDVFVALIRGSSDREH